jgi:hypothetical protein
MKPDFAKVASSRINNAITAPQVKKASKPARAPIGSIPNVGNAFGKNKSEGAKPTPKPFQPGFTAGKSGKVPPGLIKAASNRLKNRGKIRKIRKTLPVGPLKPIKDKKKRSIMPVAARGTKWYK